MNEKHMAVIERSLLSLSGERGKMRDAADALESDDAKLHLVEALRRADIELEAVYKRLFQGTYFHVSSEQMEQAGQSAAESDEVRASAKRSKGVDVPEPTEEMRLFKAEEASDSVKP